MSFKKSGEAEMIGKPIEIEKGKSKDKKDAKKSPKKDEKSK